MLCQRRPQNSASRSVAPKVQHKTKLVSVEGPGPTRSVVTRADLTRCWQGVIDAVDPSVLLKGGKNDLLVRALGNETA